MLPLLALPLTVLTSPIAAGADAASTNSFEPTFTIQNLIEDKGEVEHDFDNNVWIGRQGVRIQYGASELVADQVAVSEVTGDAIADGNVRLTSEGQYWTGDHLEYNFKTHTMKTGSYRAGLSPFYVSGLSLNTTIDQNYVSTNAFFTSDNLKNPGVRIKAQQLIIKPGEYIDAKNATVYLGSMPAFFLPYYHRDLAKHRGFFKFTPGYRSAYGPYLLSSYHYAVTEQLSAAIDFDIYQKRGVGYGPELYYDFGRYGEGAFSYYRIEDQSPGSDPFTFLPIPEERQRISFSHQATLATNLTAKVVVNQQSDPRTLRDFFESEYRRNSQPKSFLEVNQLWRNWSLDVLAQAQVNEFFQTVERLPDVKLTAFRQQLGETPFYYEGENSAGYFRFQPGFPGGTNYAAVRADSFHQVVMPQTYFGWLNFTPRVGGRFTHYGETDGYGSEFDERERGIFNTGAETSFKASRVWRGVENKWFEIKELRHIIQPSINYVFVPHPNYSPDELPQFDREIPSLRLRPIDFPDYNAIDSIDSENVMRLGLRNKLQTKRWDGIQNVVNWAIMTDLRLDPEPGQGDFSDIYSDLDLRPRSWLALNSETRWDTDRSEWKGANHSMTISPGDQWSLKLGHRYFRGEPSFGPDSDNNVIYSSIFLKFNENWASRITHHFEARDGTLEEQYYTLYRDFRSWTGALTFRIRDNRDGQDDFAVAFTFSLKASPRYTQGADRDYPDFLLGS
jgi:lipopolysaccharide assembly outer membrane protein LptD (OstA)